MSYQEPYWGGLSDFVFQVPGSSYRRELCNLHLPTKPWVFVSTLLVGGLQRRIGGLTDPGRVSLRVLQLHQGHPCTSFCGLSQKLIVLDLHDDDLSTLRNCTITHSITQDGRSQLRLVFLRQLLDL